MKCFSIALVASALTTCAALADSCPPPPDHSESLDRLIVEIGEAGSENEARRIANRMWEYWADAPNEQAQAILDRGMTKRASWNLLGAREEFDLLVEYCPDYAEGYNQRAFVNFLRQDFAAALVDLDRAIELSPRHVAALSGRALSLLGLGRVEEARDALQDALE
ncbi:hypothetical protein AB9K41_29600, partial [Cribrihabitans sp. XS_ASV171]